MGAYARASKDSINGSHPPADWSKAHDRGSINRPDESFRSLVVRKLTLLQLPVADAGGSASQASIYTQRYRCGRTANSRKTDIFVRGDKSAGRPLSSSSGSRTRKGNCNALPTFAPTQRARTYRLHVGAGEDKTTGKESARSLSPVHFSKTLGSPGEVLAAPRMVGTHMSKMSRPMIAYVIARCWYALRGRTSAVAYEDLSVESKSGDAETHIRTILRKVPDARSIEPSASYSCDDGGPACQYETAEVGRHSRFQLLTVSRVCSSTSRCPRKSRKMVEPTSSVCNATR